MYLKYLKLLGHLCNPDIAQEQRHWILLEELTGEPENKQYITMIKKPTHITIYNITELIQAVILETLTFSFLMCSGLSETGLSIATRQRTCKISPDFLLLVLNI